MSGGHRNPRKIGPCLRVHSDLQALAGVFIRQIETNGTKKGNWAMKFSIPQKLVTVSILGAAALAFSGASSAAVNADAAAALAKKSDCLKCHAIDKDKKASSFKKVAEKFVNEVSLQLQDKNMLLELDEAAWEYLVEHGYDAAMGARPMARLIHEEIKVPLARKILFDKITSRATIRVSATGDKLELSVDQGQEVLHQAISGFDGLALSIS